MIGELGRGQGAGESGDQIVVAIRGVAVRQDDALGQQNGPRGHPRQQGAAIAQADDGVATTLDERLGRGRRLRRICACDFDIAGRCRKMPPQKPRFGGKADDESQAAASIVGTGACHTRPRYMPQFTRRSLARMRLPYRASAQSGK
jgi:hypothetical protein